MLIHRLFRAVRDGIQGKGLHLRSDKWPALEKQWLKEQPKCQWCNSLIKLQVHHCVPFHIDRSKELDRNNLITLCMESGIECHYQKGHLGKSWDDYNPDIKEQCAARQNGLSVMPEKSIKE